MVGGDRVRGCTEARQSVAIIRCDHHFSELSAADKWHVLLTEWNVFELELIADCHRIHVGAQPRALTWVWRFGLEYSQIKYQSIFSAE